MDNNLEKLHKAHYGCMRWCVLNIILGSFLMSFGFLSAINDREFTIASVLIGVIGAALIYVGCRDIKETLEDMHEFEDVLFESHLGRFDDLKAIQDEIDELVKKITSEKIDKCGCGSAMVITKGDKLVCRKCGAVIKETIKK